MLCSETLPDHWRQGEAKADNDGAELFAAALLFGESSCELLLCKDAALDEDRAERSRGPPKSAIVGRGGHQQPKGLGAASRTDAAATP
jgi:hypothetical protein